MERDIDHPVFQQEYLCVPVPCRANPCPFCGEKPLRKKNPEGQHYLECSNLIDCEGWPYTNPHAEEADAVAEWNAIKKPTDSDS